MKCLVSITNDNLTNIFYVCVWVFRYYGSTHCVVTESFTYFQPKLYDFNDVKVWKELKN